MLKNLPLLSLFFAVSLPSSCSLPPLRRLGLQQSGASRSQVPQPYGVAREEVPPFPSSSSEDGSLFSSPHRDESFRSRVRAYTFGLWREGGEEGGSGEEGGRRGKGWKRAKLRRAVIKVVKCGRHSRAAATSPTSFGSLSTFDFGARRDCGRKGFSLNPRPEIETEDPDWDLLDGAQEIPDEGLLRSPGSLRTLDFQPHPYARSLSRSSSASRSPVSRRKPSFFPSPTGGEEGVPKEEVGQQEEEMNQVEQPEREEEGTLTVPQMDPVHFSPLENHSNMQVLGAGRWKVPSEAPMFELVGAELVTPSTPILATSESPAMLAYKLLNHVPGHFHFVFNFILESYQLSITFRGPPLNGEEALTPESLLMKKFMEEDEEKQKKRVKVVVDVLEGPWMLKKMAQMKPSSHLGKAPSSVKVLEGGKGVEMTVRASQSAAAKKAMGLAIPAADSIVVQLGFVLEALQNDELPERLFGGIRIDKLNFDSARKIKN